MTRNPDTLLTALYVFCDDHVIEPRRIGRPPKLSDAELVCLAMAQVLLGFPSARHWIRYAHRHLRGLFPGLPQQSGYNKRLNAAGRELLARARPTRNATLRAALDEAAGNPELAPLVAALETLPPAPVGP
ncbi:hypothetical protein HDA32_003266 [Spinactinospora alkalitolerans]|uniref:Transposase n=1 Tax=Spinactinospora alkalitolerans TaxID=687207 RepID=A0A852TUM4_9ACTN|nr:hypothetical protein [Spinactinospora alkalitolerans]